MGDFTIEDAEGIPDYEVRRPNFSELRNWAGKKRVKKEGKKEGKNEGEGERGSGGGGARQTK